MGLSRQECEVRRTNISCDGCRSASPDVWEEQVSEGGEDAVDGEQVQELVVAGRAVDSVEDVFCDPHCHEQDADYDGEAENSHENVAVIGARRDPRDQGECT